MSTRNSRLGPGPISRITRKQLLQAARRFYLLGHTQTAIAQDMALSNSYVARLLKQAREDGLVRIFVDADREAELAAEIMARYPQLIHVEVVPSFEDRTETAQAVATVAARWFDELVDTDEAGGEPKIERVAIGGGMVHQFLVEQVGRRPNRLMVGPTALTSSPAKVTRFTAPIVAARLADRLGALTPGSATSHEANRQGYLYCPTMRTPTKDVETLRTFFQELETDPDYLEMSEFWRDVDVAFVSAVRAEFVYSDIAQRLPNFGASLSEMAGKGATVAFANRFLNDNGQEVPLADGVLSYEPVIPSEFLRLAVQRRHAAKRNTGYVVLDAWGPRGNVARQVIEGGLCNVLLADAYVGNDLVK